MSRRTIISGGIALLLLGTISAGPAESTQAAPDPQARIKSLETQLQAERARNAQLSAELAAAKVELAVTRLNAANIVIPHQSGQTVPGDWKVRQFNGMDYYLVPLTAEPAVRVVPQHP